MDGGELSSGPIGSAASLLDALIAQHQCVAAAQAQLASLTVAFAECRTADDKAELESSSEESWPGRARPGEFVADEVSLALRMSVWEAQRLVARSRRVRSEMPTVWQAALAGRLDEPRLVRIDQASRLIENPHTLAALDETVVEVAAAKTVKQLVSWLERFLAEWEPEAYRHRHQVSLADRNVSVRQGLHGTAFVSSIVSGVDGAAIDLRLDSLARACGAVDPRSITQRRADLFADLLLGRIVVEGQAGPSRDRPGASAAAGGVAVDSAGEDTADAEAGDAEAAEDRAAEDEAPGDVREVEIIDPDTGEYLGTRLQRCTADGEDLDEPLWASPFTLRPAAGTPSTIGVIVPLSTLTGETDRPGRFADRSGCVPADQIRDVVAQPGTLFYRLLTDDAGHLLDVTRMGRFATGMLGLAVKVRDGTCRFPTCTVPADRCDLDHHEPAPRGPTTADNLSSKSRRHHRAKTHAGFHSWREGREIFWTTPTGHTYRRLDDPLT